MVNFKSYFNSIKFLGFISRYLKPIICVAFLYVGFGFLVDSYWVIFSDSFSLNEFVKNLTERIDHATIWLAGLTFLFSAKTWHKELVDDERIKVVLVCKENGEEKVLSYEPMRRECTRAEIQGLLRLFYEERQQYGNNSIANKEFFKRLYDVQRNQSNELRIEFPKAEYDRFSDVADTA